MCWNLDPQTGMGRCIALCKGTISQCGKAPQNCCPDHFACIIPASRVLSLCFEYCDPLTQDCLDESDQCYYVGAAFFCQPDVSGDMGAIGDPCDLQEDCDPGTYCGSPLAHPKCDPNANGCCIPFCSLEMPNCLMGLECVPWNEPLWPSSEIYSNLGLCMAP